MKVKTRWTGVENYVAQMQKLFPKKKTSSPSRLAVGRPRQEGRCAVAGHGRLLLSPLLNLAAAKNFDYYICEAFDHVQGRERRRGRAFWGILDARRLEIQFHRHAHLVRAWATYAGVAAAGSLIIGLIVLLLIPAVGFQGYLLVSGIVGLVVSGFVHRRSGRRCAMSTGHSRRRAVHRAGGPVHRSAPDHRNLRMALSLWRKGRKPMRPDNSRSAKVSIHVPLLQRGRRQMVIQTLNALAVSTIRISRSSCLDNTHDPEIRIVETGERVQRLYHHLRRLVVAGHMGSRLWA